MLIILPILPIHLFLQFRFWFWIPVPVPVPDPDFLVFRKLLKEEHLKTLREREDVEFAYVAWSILARIIYKLKDQSGVKVIQK